MEEAWHAKCSSGWPAPPAAPLFPPLTAASCNQINVNGQHFYHPDVMQSANLGSSQLFQAPWLPRAFNKDLSKSGKLETGNSFLSLLSGRSHNLSGELLPQLNSSSELPKLPVSDRDAFKHSSTCNFSSTFVSPSLKYHCNDAIFNGEHPSFSASRSLAADLPKELRPLVPHSDILGFSKAVSRHPSEDITRGMGVSSRRLHQNNQESQNLLPAANVHGIVSPLLLRDHPRVLCMNTAGELFVDDMGFLRVLCSCHSVPMSVAKFCQHSGLSSTSPCDIIRMENGLTLAQWCKMCFGHMTLGDRRGPDPSKKNSVERCSIGSNASSFSSLSKNHGTINSVKVYSELGRSGELKDDSLYAHCPNLVGKVSTEKPVINDIDYENEKRNSGGNGPLHLTGLTQGTIPVTPEKSNLQFVREIPEFLNTQRLHWIPNRREPNTASELLANNVKFGAGSRIMSAPHAPAGAKNNFIHGQNISTHVSSSNDAFVVDRNGSDLRLGQPYQDTHSSLCFFPASVNLSLPPVCFSPELQQQDQLTDRSDFSRETKRARLNQPSPPPETSTSVRRTPHPENRTTFSFHNSDSENLLRKDSSISLFLSHLTGGTGLSDCSNRSLDAKSTVASSSNCDLLPYRENLSWCTRNEIDEFGKASSLDEIDYFNSKGRFPNGVTDSSRNMDNTDVHSKQIEDRRVIQSSINGQSFHSCPANMENSSLFSNQPFRCSHTGTDSKNSNKNGKMASLEDCYHLSNVIVHGSQIPATQCGGSPGCLESEAPFTMSSVNSNHVLETNCLSCKENIKFPDHLMDGNSRFLASLRHECLMAKQEQVSAFKRKSQHGKFCCLSAMESHKNSCIDDLTGQKNGTYFNINQNKSDLYSGSKCCYNNHFGSFHCELSSGASYKCSNCTASGQRTSPCSMFSSHHICGTKCHLCFRPREISSNTSLHNEYEMCNYKRGGLSVRGNCCCATYSKCMAGCSLNGALNTPDIMNDQNVNGILNHINPSLEKDATFPSGRTIELEQSTSFKKIVSTPKNNQTGFWRDASSKIIGYSSKIPENHAETSEAGCKKLDGAFRASISLDAQQIFDPPRSSTPGITEVSVEVNKRDSQISKINTGMILHYSLFDEESGIEKCCSSDEGPNTKKCEGVDTSGMSSHSCDNIVAEFKLGGSSKKKGRNKIIVESTEKENCQRHQLTRVCKLRKRNEPSNSDEYNDVVPDSDFFLAHSELPQSIDEVKCLHPLSKSDALDPGNAVEDTCIISSGSSNIKQKRSDFPSSKFVSLKKLGDQISYSNNVHLPEESKNLVPVFQKLKFSSHGKHDAIKRQNHLNGERPPKYMLLSSIMDSTNHESETTTISRRPIVCGNSGIISSGEFNALQRSPKIVPLNLILKKARRCTSNSEIEPKTSLISKMECTGVKDQNCRELSSCKLPDGSGNPYFGRSKVGYNKQFMSGRGYHLSKLDSRKGIEGAWYAEIRTRNMSMNMKADAGYCWKMHKERNSRSEPSSVEVSLCCVCGSSNNETTNCLLECNGCLIRVHQACYGISKVPKDVWYCTLCKRNSHNIGLPQNYIDEVDHENIRFYEKCMLHTRNDYHIDCPPMNAEAPSCIIKEWSCARTEGFKGRGKGRFPNYQNPFNDGDGCIVSQVQINAWAHINGQKSLRGGVEPTCSDVEHDLRKEYVRYKLSKGWKHLVVYNSGIHDLGLYTSRFITRGAMVVEYVGEVVGLRVADKREIEYQSGRRLQCKSACYFFRIDKEHIIDATRKGGIARFVNHSCLPNCIAKVISIKNEKKVVFFAERDINPGEEVTYDYHFNREDEGKKIPCFCNSKNCKRFLN